jgi:hypothetical protein
MASEASSLAVVKLELAVDTTGGLVISGSVWSEVEASEGEDEVTTGGFVVGRLVGT